MRLPLFLLAITLLLPATAAPWTLEEVRARSTLRCGVSADSAGFSKVDSDGHWRGLDVDLCRAVAAAALGDAQKVEFVPFGATGGVTALLSGKVDLLAGHTQPWSFTAETALALAFTAVSWYDELGMGVIAGPEGRSGVETELKEAKLCLAPGEESWQVKNFARSKGLLPEEVHFENGEAAVEGLMDGRCNLLVRPFTTLQALALEHEKGERLVILPDSLGRISWGPQVRQGDDAWLTLVRWSLFAMIDAEALGISSENAAAMKSVQRPEVVRFFQRGNEALAGAGLRPGWSARIISQVGNYGESVERNLGDGSPLPLERGRNRLWKDGGLIYAPPLE